VISEDQLEFVLSIQESIIDLDSRIIEIEKLNSELMRKLVSKLTEIQEINGLLCEEIKKR
jgi:hypothetical protein